MRGFSVFFAPANAEPMLAAMRQNRASDANAAIGVDLATECK
jgi:hypothetical protein